MTGLSLQRVDDTTEAVEALVARCGGRVPLADLLGDLPRRLRRVRAPGRAVHEAWYLDPRDQVDLRWWPQGVSTAADAGRADTAGRRVVVMTSYAKKLRWHPSEQGSRVTFLDLDADRYRHVLLVRPRADGGLEPLRVHAGGVVWYGDHLYVAATRRGLYSCRVDDLVRVPSRADAFGYRYVLPVRAFHRAATDEGADGFRYSFLSLDRSTEPPTLLAGEYGGPSAPTRRLASFSLEGPTTALETLGEGPPRMQGAVHARGRLHLSVSEGRRRRGSVYAGPLDALVHHPRATPMGNEDLAYWPEQDLLYSVSEHPSARWLFTMRRSSFD